MSAPKLKQEDEFQIDQDRWSKVKERSKYIEENYRVKLVQGLQNEGTQTQWIRLRGKEASRKAAKEYIKSLCNPTETIPVRYPNGLHPVLSNLAILSKLEKRCNVAIQKKKKGELYICGTDPTPVTLALSAIEELLRKFEENGAFDDEGKSSFSMPSFLKRNIGDSKDDVLASDEIKRLPLGVREIIASWFEEEPTELWYDQQDVNKGLGNEDGAETVKKRAKASMLGLDSFGSLESQEQRPGAVPKDNGLKNMRQSDFFRSSPNGGKGRGTHMKSSVLGTDREVLRKIGKERNYTDEEIDTVFASFHGDFDETQFIRALLNHKKKQKLEGANGTTYRAGEHNPIDGTKSPINNEHYNGAGAGVLVRNRSSPTMSTSETKISNLPADPQSKAETHHLDPYLRRFMGGDDTSLDRDAMLAEKAERMKLLEDAYNAEQRRKVVQETMKNEDKQQQLKEHFYRKAEKKSNAGRKVSSPLFSDLEKGDMGVRGCHTYVSNNTSKMDALDSFSMRNADPPLEPAHTKPVTNHAPSQPIAMKSRHHHAMPYSHVTGGSPGKGAPRGGMSGSPKSRNAYMGRSGSPNHKVGKQHYSSSPNRAESSHPALDDDLHHIVIDGSNVAVAHGNQEFFSCKGLEICINYFLNRGHKNVTAFVPQTRQRAPNGKNQIEDQHLLEELRKRGHLVFTPARRVAGKNIVCHDDMYVLKLALEKDGIVVSNDNYRDHYAGSPEFKDIIENRILMFTFVGDLFMPPNDPLGRDGPHLDDFLKKSGHKKISLNRAPGITPHRPQLHQQQHPPNYQYQNAATTFKGLVPPQIRQMPPANQQHRRTPPARASNLRSSAATESLKKDLNGIFEGSEEIVKRILENHPDETDLEKLSSYILDVLN